ncbi:MAG TPA: hypothetical protein VJM12_00270 [Pyrinomonadaceae bacterium]|nr:hypothetical protein [Pyrinomonadaceae bacterium]
MQRKLFVLVFICGMVLFAIANIVDYSRTNPPCCDFSAPFGVPLTLGWWGGFVGGMSIVWQGLIADILIAAVSSLLLAFIAEKLFRKISHRSP